jgi:hypothetical protein
MDVQSVKRCSITMRIRDKSFHHCLFPGKAAPPEPPPAHYFLLGRCARAEPAAVFATLLARGSRRTFEAALAAFWLVTSLFLFLFAT